MILITGATGLLGSYLLLDLLSENNSDIKALYRNKSSIQKTETIFSYYKKENLLSKIKWIKADVRDYGSIENHIDASTMVYHLAAVVDFGKLSKTEIYDINVNGSKNVVNACLNKNAKKLCFASSVAAIGKSNSDDPSNESHHFNKAKANSIYSLSKYFAQQEVWRGYHEGLDTVVVNPSIILGAGNWNSGSSKLFSFAKKNKFHTDGITGYVDVRDVARIMKILMNSDISGESFILNSENLSYKDLFSKIAIAMGQKAPNIRVSKKLMEILWRSLAIGKLFGLRPSITREIAKASFSKTFYSAQKIKDAINYEFIEIDSSINHIAEIYKKQFNNE